MSTGACGERSCGQLAQALRLVEALLTLSVACSSSRRWSGFSFAFDDIETGVELRGGGRGAKPRSDFDSLEAHLCKSLASWRASVDELIGLPSSTSETNKRHFEIA